MKTFRLVLLAAGTLLVVALLYALFGNYSTGSRGGTVAKFSRRGTLIKTFEGQLNVGAFSDREGSFAPEIWDFSVHGGQTDVQRALEEALLEGHRVKLYYHENFFRYFWQGETKYFVHKVERTARPAPPAVP